MDDKDSGFQFITEKIKERPFDKKGFLLYCIRLLGSAVIFGLVAALVFNAFIKKSGPGNQTIPVNITSKDENKENKEKVSDNAVSDNTGENSVSGSEAEPTQIINNITEMVSLTTDDYKQLYATLSDAAEEVSKSIVTVTGVASDTDWFETTYEDKSSGAGVIVANNGRELLVLVNSETTADADRITVTFSDGTMADATVKRVDENTNFEIIAIAMEDISDETMDVISEATLGSSRGSNLTETPVMAVGRPYGSSGSVAFGLITDNSRSETMTDRNMTIISTDIYGSSEASGAIFNYEGEVLGIIAPDTGAKDIENLISGYAISDLKEVIESLSNDRSTACLGIRGNDVTEAAHEEMGLPYGAYVTKVVIDSPAMTAGIQSGDVITKVGTREISSYSDYEKAIMEAQPGDDAVITAERYAKGDYTEMTFDVTYVKLDDALAAE
ncbi:MAG: S1C family serine protease [Lachnospiraceae bacterium]|nr:S1C family serine protease [Lachnospiraceae bacterium]